MDWLDIGVRLGVPLLILAGLAFGIWRAASVVWPFIAGEVWPFVKKVYDDFKTERDGYRGEIQGTQTQFREALAAVLALRETERKESLRAFENMNRTMGRMIVSMDNINSSLDALHKYSTEQTNAIMETIEKSRRQKK